MKQQPQKIYRLAEHRLADFPEAEFQLPMAELIWDRYDKQVEMLEPTHKNRRRWQLASRGWVGQIPLNQGIVLALEPKTPIHNLFGMLEYAYRLKSIRFLPQIVHTDSLQEFYAQLANVLAKRVIDRSRRGLYRTYRAEEERLPYIRGRMDVVRTSRRPWDTRTHCHFEDHTADVEDNRILAWTLWRIMRSGTCGEQVLPTVRRAFRILQSATQLEPYSANSCLDRFYHRLNDDYQPLHALSRFFLDQAGPSHRIGDREMTPFLIDMAQLFELFVVEWLKANAPPGWRIEAKVKLSLGAEQARTVQPDIVIKENATGRVLFVLDTKYKVTEEPSIADINQMTTYAHLMNCRRAVLIYPEGKTGAVAYDMRGIYVHSLSFALEHDLDASGNALIEALSDLV